MSSPPASCWSEGGGRRLELRPNQPVKGDPGKLRLGRKNGRGHVRLPVRADNTLSIWSGETKGVGAERTPRLAGTPRHESRGRAFIWSSHSNGQAWVWIRVTRVSRQGHVPPPLRSRRHMATRGSSPGFCPENGHFLHMAKRQALHQNFFCAT